MPSPIGTLAKKFWQHPLTRGIEIDSPESFEIHRRLLQINPLLNRLYLKWYRQCLPAYEETKGLEGDMIEIGSGVGFLEQVIPGLVKTDVAPNPCASKVLDAMKMDYGDNELRAIFAVGVLHHLSHPRAFLAEAERCLQPGGRVVLVEPSNNFPVRFLVQHLDHYEYFDDKIEDWINGSAGRLSHANNALPWVIFVRDRSRFEKEFPDLKILNIRYHTVLGYLVTGGMTYRPFLPSFAAPLIDLIDECLARPFMDRVATMMTIDLVKTPVPHIVRNNHPHSL